MGNSPLVTYTRLSPNHSGKRTHTIDRITPHAVVGQLSVERICDCFKDNWLFSKLGDLAQAVNSRLGV